METDPNRQWFVYDREREQGPYSELELKLKIESGEFSSEAYVYTEGMPDWALISDTEVLQEKELKESKEQAFVPSQSVTGHSDVERLGAEGPSPSESSGHAAEKTLIQKAPEDVKLKKASSSKKTTMSKLTKAAIVLLTIGCLGIVSYFYSPAIGLYVQKAKTLVLGSLQQDVSGESSEVQQDRSKSAWSHFESFRSESNRNSPAFMVEVSKVDRSYPLVRGAISSLLKITEVDVAIFPDSEKNLMAVPALWRVKVPVFEGYFVIGPLKLNKSEELPPGRWVVMAANAGVFLGEATFEVGDWPSQPELVLYREKISAETQGLAAKEIEILQAKVKEFEAAASQLRQNTKHAEAGKKNRNAWLVFYDKWRTKIELAVEDQKKVLAGPMFYAQNQTQLYNALNDLSKVGANLELLSVGGPRKLQSESLISVKEIWPSFSRSERELYATVEKLKVSPQVAPLSIDREIVRLQLLEK